MWATLPAWFWVIYYVFLLTTLGTTFVGLGMRKPKGMSILINGLSIIAILITLTVPIINMLAGIGRPEGNELEHLLSHFERGATWSIIVIYGYLYLLFWWVIFIVTVLAGYIFLENKT
ncbi:hypothetical protein LC087_16020 [Bacillus carboniphilus]|uniref:Uncharacterized protein n=1 Tax=Bacillus carboniphilus TaxID=86663 RepID=A0ABY9JX27_9BACI|nr:hypothetical protein [Bacillus carboniphilus]WLR42226.1 hypothetical protein LC087_16020 [Bacillus carboniphilus]